MIRITRRIRPMTNPTMTAATMIRTTNRITTTAIMTTAIMTTATMAKAEFFSASTGENNRKHRKKREKIQPFSVSPAGLRERHGKD